MKGVRIGLWAAAVLVLSVAGSCKRAANVAGSLDIVDSIGYNIHDHADRLHRAATSDSGNILSSS